MGIPALCEMAMHKVLAMLAVCIAISVAFEAENSVAPLDDSVSMVQQSKGGARKAEKAAASAENAAAKAEAAKHKAEEGSAVGGEESCGARKANYRSKEQRGKQSKE